MAGSDQARDYKVYFDTDADPAVKTEIEGAMDISIETGADVGGEVTRSGVYTFGAEEPFIVTFDLVRENPRGTGQALLETLGDGLTLRKCYVESGTAGGDTWEFSGRVAISGRDIPTRGQQKWSVRIMADGAITKGVASA